MIKINNENMLGDKIKLRMHTTKNKCTGKMNKGSAKYCPFVEIAVKAAKPTATTS